MNKIRLNENLERYLNEGEHIESVTHKFSNLTSKQLTALQKQGWKIITEIDSTTKLMELKVRLF